MLRLTPEQQSTVERNAALVTHTVKRMPAALIATLGGYDDAHALAMQAACEAVPYFDPKRGALSTLLVWSVRRRLQNAARKEAKHFRPMRKPRRLVDLPDRTPDDREEAAALRVRISYAIRRITSPLARVVATRHLLEGVPLLDIAAERGCSGQNVRHAWTAARKVLREVLS